MPCRQQERERERESGGALLSATIWHKSHDDSARRSQNQKVCALCARDINFNKLKRSTCLFSLKFNENKNIQPNPLWICRQSHRIVVHRVC